MEAVPRRVRAPAPLPPSLPPMTEQSPLGSDFDSVYHISNCDKEDPFSDPPGLNPQVPTGLANTNEVKQSVWPSQSRKGALAEKSVNRPVLGDNTIASTSNAANPSSTGRNSTYPRKICIIIRITYWERSSRLSTNVGECVLQVDHPHDLIKFVTMRPPPNTKTSCAAYLLPRPKALFLKIFFDDLRPEPREKKLVRHTIHRLWDR